MKVIRFMTGYRMYQPGETAGFADAEAGALISAGIAIDEAEAQAKAAAAAEAQAKAATEKPKRG